MTKFIAIGLLLSAILGAYTTAVYNWGKSVTETRVQQALSEALQEQERLNTMIAESAEKVRQQAIETGRKAHADQRTIQRLKSELSTNIPADAGRCTGNEPVNPVAVRLLDAAVCSSPLQPQLPAVCDEKDTPITTLDLVGYTRYVIDQYQQEAIRANELRHHR